MILGREGIHQWTAADGPTIELNRVKEDDGDPAHPYVKLRDIGLHALGEAEDNRSPLVGDDGEIVRTSRRRGKTVPYSGVVRARSSYELRSYQDEIREAFSGRNAEGRMDVFPHPLNPQFDPGEAERYFNARVLSLDMDDVRASKRYESTFVLNLRLSDPRYFEQLTLARFKASILEKFDPLQYVTFDAVDGLNDLASGNHDATTTGSPTVGAGAGLLAGISGDSSTDLDGSNDQLNLGWDAGSLYRGSDTSLLLWFQRDTSSTIDTLLATQDGAAVDLRLLIGSQDIAYGATESWLLPGVVNDQPVSFGARVSYSDSTIEVFCNGVGLGAKSEVPPTANRVILGNGPVASPWFDGLVAHYILLDGLASDEVFAQAHEWASLGRRGYF